jgi:hypothetical protein
MGGRSRPAGTGIRCGDARGPWVAVNGAAVRPCTRVFTKCIGTPKSVDWGGGCRTKGFHIMHSIQPASIQRREFLRRAGMGVALFNILPGTTAQGADRLSANDKLNLAGIGIGSRGGADVAEAAGLGHRIVALCDVDEKYAAKEFAKYPDARRFTDYRVMLDKMGAGDRRRGHRHARPHARGDRHGGHAARQARVLREAPRAYRRRSPQASPLGLEEAPGRHAARQPGALHRHHSPRVRMDLGRRASATCIRSTPPATRSRTSTARSRSCRSWPRSTRFPQGLDYDLWVGPAEYASVFAALGAVELAGLALLRRRHHRRLDLPCRGSELLGASIWERPRVCTPRRRTTIVAQHGQTYPPGAKITFEFPAKGGARPCETGVARRQDSDSAAGRHSGPTTRFPAPARSSMATRR